MNEGSPSDNKGVDSMEGEGFVRRVRLYWPPTRLSGDIASTSAVDDGEGMVRTAAAV